MKCVHISAHGENIEALLAMTNDASKPVRNEGELLIRVQACALAPGDIRVLKGHCDYFQSPGGFPYIPGGDLCGIVEEADEDSRFKVGDCVMAMFELPRPLGGLAEYAVVKESLAELKPATASSIEASTLPSSAMTAMFAADFYVKAGHRVLVLGASGGVGTFFVQLARNAGASFIAATSTDEPLLKSLEVDRVIDYTKQNWWEIPEFLANPFDVIVDLAGGREPWMMAMQTPALKKGWSGGKYVVMNGDNPLMEIHNMWQTLKFVSGLQGRWMWTTMWPFVPRYIWHSGLDIKAGTLKRLAELVDNGKLKVILDPISPVPFEIEGVQRAFRLMESRHAHGKVVVQISQPNPQSS